MTVVVLGGAGAMGRITVRDLVETAPKDTRIVIADRNFKEAKKLAKSYQDRRVVAAEADVTDVRATAKLLKGAFAAICSVQYQFNVPVMKAALKAGCHYVDLGGLFHVTLKQLELHRKFEKAGLLALLGVGAAPGITNLLARRAADEMDEVHEIHFQLGSIDRTPMAATSPMGTSYSIMTILEEASKPAAVFTQGSLQFVEPMSGEIDVDFPEPVGKKRPALTIHSEIATLPASYAHKGIREATFRIAFDPELTSRLRILRELGLTSAEPVRADGAEVAPMKVLLAALAKLPKPEPAGPPDQHEVVRAVVRGTKEGAPVEEVLDLHCPGVREWEIGVDADTGCPPSVAVQMLARGEITARGVLPPEQAIPVEPFFAELEKRGMRVERTRR